MCDRAYPKKLAFQYLEDLKNEFERVNGPQIETAARPYAFIKFGSSHFFLHGSFMRFIFLQHCFLCFFWWIWFSHLFLCLKDTFIHKTKKLYQDTRTQRNISKLNDELYEVHQIMTRNVQEVLGVGEKLDRKIFPFFKEIIRFCYIVLFLYLFKATNIMELFKLRHCWIQKFMSLGSTCAFN
jgi:vesicle transport protein SEC22